MCRGQDLGHSLWWHSVVSFPAKLQDHHDVPRHALSWDETILFYHCDQRPSKSSLIWLFHALRQPHEHCPFCGTIVPGSCVLFLWVHGSCSFLGWNNLQFWFIAGRYYREGGYGIAKSASAPNRLWTVRLVRIASLRQCIVIFAQSGRFHFFVSRLFRVLRHCKICISSK